MASSISCSKAIAHDRKVRGKIDTLSAIFVCSPQMKNCIRVASFGESSFPVFTLNSAAYSLGDFEPSERFAMFCRACLPVAYFKIYPAKQAGKIPNQGVGHPPRLRRHAVY